MGRQKWGHFWPVRFKTALLAAGLGLHWSGLAQDPPSAGPAWQTFPLTLGIGTRTEIAGPFYYRQQKDGELTRAWPPFYSRTTDPSLASREDNFLYPLFSFDRYGREYRWQIGQLFSFSGGDNPTAAGNRRFTIYPFYFQQRSTNATDNYTAVLPFYGHIKDRLLLNDVSFIMFPVYAQTRKHGYVTDNYLYPFVAVRHGDHLAGWQFWPFYGEEHQSVTQTTNGFGDVSLVPGHDKIFACTPLYYQNVEGLGTDNPVRSLGVIPFYARMRSPQHDSTSYLWPFFTWIEDRQKNYHEFQGPWPFVIYTRGPGKHTTRFWPLFSESRDAHWESDLYLWPLYQYRGFHTESLATARTRVMFYLYQQIRETNLMSGATKKRLDMWPFFTWQQDPQGSARLQILAPVEAAVENQRGIERNWAPLWSLWRAESNATNGCASQSLLWNLYRHESQPGHKKSSLAFGLLQYSQADGTNRVRLFYGLNFHWPKRVNPAGN